MSILIRNIKSLVQIRREQPEIIKGKEMSKLPCLNAGWLLIEDEHIKDFGPTGTCPERADLIIEGSSRFLLPAWCDSHTHLVFAGSREGEMVGRIQGLSYEEIARQGGGILNSAARLRETSEESLFESALRRLEEIRNLGTGAVEIKSGYGLDTESEMKMLRVIRKLKEHSDLIIKSTFLGAHAIPLEFKANREDYIQLLINEMIPRVAGEGLADYCDVFCDRGFFTVEETSAILEAGLNHGLRPKIHANELDFSGGVQVGVKHGALSVDHLECVGADEIDSLMDSGTMPTLLPSTAFFLGLEYAPARKMIDAGLPVALATDYNPGSSPSGRMAFVISLACLKMKMLPEEAINACTINSAYAMDVLDDAGSITEGKLANLILTKPISSIASIPYAFGSDLIDKVILKGRIQ